MHSAKVANRLFVGSVAFGASFLVGLLLHRNFRTALLTGTLAGAATSVGAVVADSRRFHRGQWRIDFLEKEIRALEAEELELLDLLSEVSVTKQQLEASIGALHGERTQLLARVGELHNQRNLAYQELTDIQQQKQREEQEFYVLQNQLQQFEQQQAELSQSLSAKISQIQQTEAQLNRLRQEGEQLQAQFTQQQQQCDRLKEELSTLEGRKLLLNGESRDLQTQIPVLEQRRDELNQTLLSLQLQKQKIEGNLATQQTELKQLKSQITEQQQQRVQLHQDLANLEREKQQLEAQLRDRQTSGGESAGIVSRFLPEEWREWLEFARKLSSDERHALRAILEKDEATLKQIADRKSTMPQVLVEAINQQALETFGDTLFIGGSSLGIPEIHDEYRGIFTEAIALQFKDLLDIPELRNVTSASGRPRSR
jgi:chromosome segregation ATPase